MMTTNDRSMVLIVWHDAHAINEGHWCDEADIDDEPCIVQSVGWLFPDKKQDHVVIAQSVTDDGSLDSVLAIPVGMVKKVVVLGSVTHDVPPFGIVAGAGAAQK
jgi:hypothetical protein